MTRVKNPQLLRNLHEVWTVHGCGICGDQQVELHHVVPRGQQGADSAGNIVGLCGAFTKNHHHLEVTENRIRLTPSSGGWGWKNQVTGEWGYVRLPTGLEEAAVVADPSLGGSTVGNGRHAATGAKTGAVIPADDGEQPPVAPSSPDPEGVPESSPQGAVVSNPLHTGSSPAGKQTPEQRFALLQSLARASHDTLLSLAMGLRLAKEERDWERLGFDEWADYVGEAGLGLSSGSVSKMLKVASFYEPVWPDVIAAAPSVERLYLSQRVNEGAGAALAEAVSVPAYVLAERAKGEPAPEDQPRCESCGQVLRVSHEERKHVVARHERAESRQEADARSSS